VSHERPPTRVSNAELRALAGLDPPKPTLGAQWKTIKQVAGWTGNAESTVRSWITSGKIEARKIGGRILINAESLPPRCETAR
jgi:excisionase family DNA binding protein